MIALEISVVRGCRRNGSARQHVSNRAQKVLRTVGLHDDPGDPALFRKSRGFALVIIGRIENDGRPGESRIASQLANEFIAVHGWHENVRDDELRSIQFGGAQPVRTIRSLHCSVTFVLKEHEHGLATGRTVVNN